MLAENTPLKAYERTDLLGALDAIAADIHVWAAGKGFWNQPEALTRLCHENAEVANFIVNMRKTQKQMLCVTEVAELTEETRKAGPEDTPGITNEEAEVADLIIRALDYAAKYKLRIGAAVGAKMAKNEGRAYLHGGKKF